MHVTLMGLSCEGKKCREMCDAVMSEGGGAVARYIVAIIRTSLHYSGVFLSFIFLSFFNSFFNLFYSFFKSFFF